MMANNTDSVYDFGLAPKKKVATYGKAGRRRPGSDGARPATLRHAESAPALPTSFVKPQPRSPERPHLTTRGVSSAKVRQPNFRKYGSEARQKPAQEVHSQPLPDLYDIETQLDVEPARTKKRRVAREPSDMGKFTGPYSTPESSPLGAQSPTPPRSAGTASLSAASRQSTPERGMGMESDLPTSNPFSVKTSRTLKNLSLGSKKSGVQKQEIPIRLSGRTSSPASTVARTQKSAATVSQNQKSAATVSESQNSAATVSKSQNSAVEVARTQKPVAAAPRIQKPVATLAQAQKPVSQLVRKRRLIDTLTAQASEGPSSSEDEEPSSQRSEALKLASPPSLRSSSPPATLAPNHLKPIARPVIAAKKPGPKFTYSQQRTMLADEDPLLGGGGLGGLDDGPAGGALFNYGRLTKSATLNAFSYLDEDDDTGNAGAVRSIHELRQAGANSRFADEMDDILDRVGSPTAKPSSLRRGALLELAQKMKDKDFRQQFRNHGDSGSLFTSLGEETDLISGYAILAIVTTLLAATTSTHLILQLRSQGISTLVDTLLGSTVDIVQLAKDRKQNVSRNGQLTLATIKSSLLELPVWEPLTPASLPPRTLALKCLELLMRQPVPASVEDEVLSDAIVERLFSILADGVSDPACWDFPKQQASCNLYLALYVLESHSISAMQSGTSSLWTKQYAPIVADVLETALRLPTDQLGDLASLILRISLNITNHNGEACRLFVEKRLLQRLAESAGSAFEMVLNSMKADSFLSKVLESLIMMLGAMINFCVYYPPASQSLEGQGDSTRSPLTRLIRVFADNHAKTAEADSMEKTQLNVALGYLSILLGYLCLSESIRNRFSLVHPKKSIQPLLDSINEFIAFHRKVAEAQAAEGGKQESESASLARLQNLADQLARLR